MNFCYCRGDNGDNWPRLGGWLVGVGRVETKPNCEKTRGLRFPTQGLVVPESIGRTDLEDEDGLPGLGDLEVVVSNQPI